MKKSDLKNIWDKTSGHCHFCGKVLSFDKYGKNKFIKGSWNIDHIYPKAKGGRNILANYLPVCGECNGLRWFRIGKEIQKLLRYGIIAFREIRKKSELGKKLTRLYNIQKNINKQRRKKKS